MTHDKSADAEGKRTAIEKVIWDCQEIADLPETTLDALGEAQALKKWVIELGASLVTISKEVLELKAAVKDLESRVSTGEKGKWPAITVDSGMT